MLKLITAVSGMLLILREFINSLNNGDLLLATFLFMLIITAVVAGMEELK